MIEMEPMECAVDDKTHRHVRNFLGRDESDKLLYTYEDIVTLGSDEVKEVLFLITGGVPPAIYTKKESEVS